MKEQDQQVQKLTEENNVPLCNEELGAVSGGWDGCPTPILNDENSFKIGDTVRVIEANIWVRVVALGDGKCKVSFPSCMIRWYKNDELSKR